MKTAILIIFCLAIFASICYGLWSFSPIAFFGYLAFIIFFCSVNNQKKKKLKIKNHENLK